MGLIFGLFDQSALNYGSLSKPLRQLGLRWHVHFTRFLRLSRRSQIDRRNSDVWGKVITLWHRALRLVKDADVRGAGAGTWSRTRAFWYCSVGAWGLSGWRCYAFVWQVQQFIHLGGGDLNWFHLRQRANTLIIAAILVLFLFNFIVARFKSQARACKIGRQTHIPLWLYRF